MEKIKLFFLGNREPEYTEKLRNQVALIARILVGGYLIYLSYGLKDAVKNATAGYSFWLFLAALILFAIAGAWLLYEGLRDYIIGRYQGGKLDKGSKEEEEQAKEAE